MHIYYLHLPLSCPVSNRLLCQFFTCSLATEFFKCRISVPCCSLHLVRCSCCQHAASNQLQTHQHYSFIQTFSVELCVSVPFSMQIVLHHICLLLCNSFSDNRFRTPAPHPTPIPALLVKVSFLFQNVSLFK